MFAVQVLNLSSVFLSFEGGGSALVEGQTALLLNHHGEDDHHGSSLEFQFIFIIFNFILSPGRGVSSVGAVLKAG